MSGQELREAQGDAHAAPTAPERPSRLAVRRRRGGPRLYFVIGGIAWATFIYNGVLVPDSFTTILATIAGPGRSAEPWRDERPVPPVE